MMARAEGIAEMGKGARHWRNRLMVDYGHHEEAEKLKKGWHVTVNARSLSGSLILAEDRLVTVNAPVS